MKDNQAIVWLTYLDNIFDLIIVNADIVNAHILRSIDAKQRKKEKNI